MSITPDKAPETLLASDPNAIFLQRTDEINELLDSGASLSGHERNCFFLNTGNGKFTTASATSGFDFYDDARAVARTDWDQDGDIDLLFSNRTAPRLRFLKNNGSPDSNFVAVRLVGTDSNRDAIGARVVLKSGDRTLLRGLRAGEGFLGQSSKWIHFGLGNSTEIDSLEVDWPGGEREVFTGLKAGSWFHLTQGNGKATLRTPPDRTINLPEKELPLPQPTARAAVRLCAPMPVPELYSIGASKKPELIKPNPNRFLLVTLWASWCPACDSSFSQLSDKSTDLSKSGIDTLALSVNGLGEGDDTKFSDAGNYFKEHQLPFTLGEAHPDLLHQLQIIANRIVAQNKPLPLPSSFLFNPKGEIVAFYRGPAPVEHLLETAAAKPTDPSGYFFSTLPFPGKWSGAPRIHPVSKLVTDFIDAGFQEPGLTFAKKHKRSFEGSLRYAEVFSQVGNQYADQKDFDTAIAYYREALSEHQNAPLIHFNLALALEQQRKIPEALAQYQKAIDLDPKITVAHLNRGAILSRDARTIQQGIVSLKEAIRLNPNLAASHYYLGLALERTGQFQQAYQHYRQANLLAPDHLGNAMQLAHLLERSGKLDDALDRYLDIHRIYPKAHQAPFQIAMVLEKKKQHDKAIPYYESSLSLSPDYLPALNNLAYLLVTTPEASDPPRALRLATKAVALTEGKNPAVLDTLATTQIANGQKDEALSVLKKALILAEESELEALSRDLSEKISKLKSGK
ncbi:MAG: tetratricopeptide repeat protein [Akkermansiaceae bacterium]